MNKDLIFPELKLAGSRKQKNQDVCVVANNEKAEEICKKVYYKMWLKSRNFAETHACTAVMNTNNVFYRFRHYRAGVAYYENQPAGLHMSVMMNLVMGKEFF